MDENKNMNENNEINVPNNQEEPNQVFIIDETITSLVYNEQQISSDNSLEYEEEIPKPKKEKKPKKKKVKNKNNSKLCGWQIAIIAVLGVITLWIAIFTVDHTLAANGLSPFFSKMTQEYEDGSQSYKGLGYKIQFKFDSNGNLTQKCVPFWQTGPNDVQ
ncbi:MAG: hypothetical protein KBT46_03095 [Ruminococcus sp.]|nr:hypothetical protein [Candidatus Copronaster equi]